MTVVKWSEIEQECREYRSGFVATFQRYEGDSTDEKDKQGRVVKVTVSSFAQHMGIPEATFRGWIAKSKGAGAKVPPQRLEIALRHATPAEKERVIREAIVSDPKVAFEAVADIARKRDWRPDEIGLAVDNIRDRKLPEKFKEQLVSGKAEPIATNREGQRGWLPSTTERVVRSTETEFDGLIAYSKAAKALRDLTGFKVNNVLARADELALGHMAEDLPSYVTYLERLLAEVHRRRSGLRVVTEA